MKHVTVVGAGFSGLTVARALLKKGFDVTIIEKSDRTGGLIQTLETPFGLVEKAAPSITRTPRVDKLFQDLGLRELEPSKASKTRLFFRKRPTRWPLSVPESLHLGWKFLVSKFLKRLAPRYHETLFAWGERCLTRAAAENLLATAFQGIYAGDAKKMSARLVLAPLLAPKKSRDPYLGVAGVEGGMESLIRALENDIRKRGGRIVFQKEQVSILPKPCVLAIPASAASRLLEKEDRELASLLAGVQESPLVTATLFFKEATGPRAFGCLIPRESGLKTLGVLLNHAIFPGRDADFSETWILGGATDPSLVEKPRDGILELIRQERKIIFNRTDEPIHAEVTLWPKALPHYDLRLEDVLSRLEEPEHVWFHGNWTGSIGLSRILERSDALAERIRRELA